MFNGQSHRVPRMISFAGTIDFNSFLQLSCRRNEVLLIVYTNHDSGSESIHKHFLRRMEMNKLKIQEL